MRNDVFLMWQDGAELKPSHFRMREFENDDGLCMVDSSVVASLERVRRELSMLEDCGVQIVITSGIRTEADNERLARSRGWTEEGGAVARDSRHLVKYGGIAVDIYARKRVGGVWVLLDQTDVAKVCKEHFNYVKSSYADGHVHADNRKE